jgi:hypothetical protein
MYSLLLLPGDVPGGGNKSVEEQKRGRRMEKITEEKCRKCGKKVKEGGIRGEGADQPTVLCGKCLKAIFPEGKDMPKTMDQDGNLYFIDNARNCVIIFFSYGDVPYSSCTEVSAEEEECGCGFGLY